MVNTLYYNVQTQLTLEEGTTYSKLQGLLEESLQVPVSRQRIKAGIPPRELLPPAPGEPDVPLPLQHGDRIMLEVLPDTTGEKMLNFDQFKIQI